MEYLLSKKIRKEREDVHGYCGGCIATCMDNCYNTCSGYCDDMCTGHCQSGCSSFCKSLVF